MKSHVLAKLLLEQPDCELILQKDSEGNGYSPLSGVEFDCVYVSENTWSGELYSGRYSADDNCMEEDEWAELKKTKSGYAVLFPVN